MCVRTSNLQYAVQYENVVLYRVLLRYTGINLQMYVYNTGTVLVQDKSILVLYEYHIYNMKIYGTGDLQSRGEAERYVSYNTYSPYLQVRVSTAVALP